MKKAVWTAVAAVMGLTGLAAPASAADGKVVAGWSLIATGAGLMAGAFNYEGTTCPSGYWTHTVTDGSPPRTDTTCVRTTGYGSDVREATGSASFERPMLMWSGVAAVGVGTVLLMLPKKAKAVANGLRGSRRRSIAGPFVLHATV